MNFRSHAAIWSALALASLLAAPSESHAQLADSAHIAVGTRVWVRTRDGEVGEWRLERASPDTLTLRRRGHESDELLYVPWSKAERVDTIAIAPPSARRTLVGSAIGGFLGAAVVFVGASGTCRWDAGDCPGFGFIVLAPEIIGTGVLIGGIAGYVHRDWHWSTAWRAPRDP